MLCKTVILYKVIHIFICLHAMAMIIILFHVEEVVTWKSVTFH